MKKKRGKEFSKHEKSKVRENAEEETATGKLNFNTNTYLIN